MNTNQQIDIFRTGQPDEEAIRLLRGYEKFALSKDPQCLAFRCRKTHLAQKHGLNGGCPMQCKKNQLTNISYIWMDIMMKYDFTIPIPPVTKKNSSQILKNQKTGKPFVAPSKQYKAYEEAAGWFLKPLGIDYPVNVKALYYMPTRRKVDLCNLLSATCDILVKYGVIVDDNSGVVVSHDGSRVRYDKKNPRTEVEITELRE